jgi:hypothetical protein
MSRHYVDPAFYVTGIINQQANISPGVAEWCMEVEEN